MGIMVYAVLCGNAELYHQPYYVKETAVMPHCRYLYCFWLYCKTLQTLFQLISPKPLVSCVAVKTSLLNPKPLVPKLHLKLATELDLKGMYVMR